jgi:hypothetical protein
MLSSRAALTACGLIICAAAVCACLAALVPGLLAPSGAGGHADAGSRAAAAAQQWPAVPSLPPRLSLLSVREHVAPSGSAAAARLRPLPPLASSGQRESHASCFSCMQSEALGMFSLGAAERGCGKLEIVVYVPSAKRGCSFVVECRCIICRLKHNRI